QAPAGDISFPMFDSAGGNAVVDQNPAVTPPGLIANIPTLSFAVFTSGELPAGVYKVGIACTFAGAVEHSNYWEAPVTISGAGGSGFTGAGGTVPPAPALSSPLIPVNQSLAGSFTEGTSTPPAVGFTVTAHPANGPDLTRVVAAAGRFTMTGLATGT